MFVLCFIVHLLGTYDITEANLYNDLSNIGRVCYSCQFIRKAIVKGCLISITSSTYSTNISLICSLVRSSTVIGCTYDIPSGIYNMYVYDIEEEVDYQINGQYHLLISLLLDWHQLTHLLMWLALYPHVLFPWLQLQLEHVTI